MSKSSFIEGKGRDLSILLIVEELDAEDGWTQNEILGHISINPCLYPHGRIDSMQVLNFMAAGHKTTAGSVIWASDALTLYPELQTGMINEIENEIQPGFTLTAIKLDSLKLLGKLYSRSVKIFRSRCVTH
jgi:hypothetical protein